MPRSTAYPLPMPAEVDAHAGVIEADRMVGRIELEVAPVDRRQCRLDLLLGRMDAQRIVIKIADTRVGDVEGPVA